MNKKLFTLLLVTLIFITTSGCVINKELRELAEKNGVSVIVSPYSTAPTSMLIAYSMPVSVMGDKEIKTVSVYDSVSKIKAHSGSIWTFCSPVGKIIFSASKGNAVRKAGVCFVSAVSGRYVGR